MNTRARQAHRIASVLLEGGVLESESPRAIVSRISGDTGTSLDARSVPEKTT